MRTEKKTLSDWNQNKNKLYIGIFSLIILIVIIIFIIIKNTGFAGSSSGGQTETTGKPVSVIQENGDQKATINGNIKNIRGVKFSKSSKAVKKYENKQKDTLEGNYSEASDGYSYLTYKFNTKNIPEYYGVKVSASDAGALFQYVFYHDKLIETRLQYGNIGESGYNNVVNYLNSVYGNATYSRSYSNGTKESWYSTKTATLYVYYQSSGVNVYLRKN